MSKVVTMPLNHLTTDEQCLLRMLEAVRSGAIKNVLVIYETEDEVTYSCRAQKQHELLWNVEMVKQQILDGRYA